MGACSPQFPARLPLECATEILADIRGNNFGVPTLNKINWALGCSLALLQGQPRIMTCSSIGNITLPRSEAEPEIDVFKTGPYAEGEDFNFNSVHDHECLLEHLVEQIKAARASDVPGADAASKASGVPLAQGLDKAIPLPLIIMLAQLFGSFAKTLLEKLLQNGGHL